MIVNVLFYKNSNRETPPVGGPYRPHFVIKGKDEYLGIQFDPIPKIEFQESIIINISLLYEGVDYSELEEGVQFYIKEGPNTVGEGIVLKK